MVPTDRKDMIAESNFTDFIYQNLKLWLIFVVHKEEDYID